MNKFFYFLLILGLFACDENRLFEDNYALTENYWHVDSAARFSFEVNDPQQPYDIFINIRNSSAYPYYNLYVKYTLEDSLGKEKFSSLENLILFDAKTGEPKGSGLGDLFDHQFKLMEKYQFPQAGTYSLKYQQFMRIDSLPMVYFVGARVAKSID
ncbi:MAG: gliding motility lipoprotein GldH [Cyclobacteriaceae bacterium]